MRIKFRQFEFAFIFAPWPKNLVRDTPKRSICLRKFGNVCLWNFSIVRKRGPVIKFQPVAVVKSQNRPALTLNRDQHAG